MFYLELLGGRQTSLGLMSNVITMRSDVKTAVRQRPRPLPPAITAAEREAHDAFVATLGPTPAWGAYSAGRPSAA